MEYNPPVTYDEPESSVWQRWWVVALVTLLTLAAAGAWVHTRTPVYEATTSVRVHPLGVEDTVGIETEAELVRSTAVATGAAGRLRDGLDPTALASQVTVVAPANSEILQITYAGRSPEQARAGAHAFASAYLYHREETAEAALAERVATIEGKREELDGTLRDLNERVAVLPPGSPELGALENEREAVTGQRDTLTNRLNDLATAPVSAGIIISDAALPTAPVGPAAWVVLVSGGALGLALGLGLALLLHRSRRATPEDLSFAAPFIGGSPAALGGPPAAAPREGSPAAPLGGPRFEKPSFEGPSFEPRLPDGPRAGSPAPPSVPATAALPAAPPPAAPPVTPPRFAASPGTPPQRPEPRLADAPRFGPPAGTGPVNRPGNAGDPHRPGQRPDRTARRELSGRPLRLGPGAPGAGGPGFTDHGVDTERPTERFAGPPSQRTPEPEVVPAVAFEAQTVAMPRLDDGLLRALDSVGREHRRPH